MDATSINSRVEALVAGDSLIEQRLSELDTKLAEWLDLMRAGQAALVAALRGGHIEPRRGEVAPVASAPTEAQAVAEPVLDDEQLFASLDPETANAVRVKRRLSRDKRPLRELLAEIRTARSTEDPPAASRKRWWRRSDG